MALSQDSMRPATIRAFVRKGDEIGWSEAQVHAVIEETRRILEDTDAERAHEARVRELQDTIRGALLQDILDERLLGILCRRAAALHLSREDVDSLVEAERALLDVSAAVPGMQSFGPSDEPSGDEETPSAVRELLKASGWAPPDRGDVRDESVRAWAPEWAPARGEVATAPTGASSAESVLDEIARLTGDEVRLETHPQDEQLFLAPPDVAPLPQPAPVVPKSIAAPPPWARPDPTPTPGAQHPLRQLKLHRDAPVPERRLRAVAAHVLFSGIAVSLGIAVAVAFFVASRSTESHSLQFAFNVPALVKVNGRTVGHGWQVGPLEDIPASEILTVTIEARGYAPLVRQVRLAPGEHRTVDLELVPAREPLKAPPTETGASSVAQSD